jgi:hypothetical protein
MLAFVFVSLLPLLTLAGPTLESRATLTKVVLTNDDGWATAGIRAQRNALVAAGFNASAVVCERQASDSLYYTGDLVRPC